MTDKVTVDRDYRPVPDGSPEAAFSLHADDPRVQRPAVVVEAVKEPAPDKLEPPRKRS